MRSILLLLALASIATAFPARLRWNKNPAAEAITEYRIYQLLDGKRILKATVPAVVDAETKQVHPLDVATGQVFVVTAYNGFESEHSDPVTVPTPPTKPAGLQVVEIQTSSNMIDWKPVAYVPLRTEDKARFVRAQITTIQK